MALKRSDHVSVVTRRFSYFVDDVFEQRRRLAGRHVKATGRRSLHRSPAGRKQAKVLRPSKVDDLNEIAVKKTRAK